MYILLKIYYHFDTYLIVVISTLTTFDFLEKMIKKISNKTRNAFSKFIEIYT